MCVCSVVGACGEEWSITYQYKRNCAFVGSSVDMFCSYTNPSGLSIKQVTWTKNINVNPPDLCYDPNYRNRISEGCQHGNKRCYLRINSLTKLDSSNYYCSITTYRTVKKWIGTPGIHLDVKGKDKQNLSMLICMCVFV